MSRAGRRFPSFTGCAWECIGWGSFAAWWVFGETGQPLKHSFAEGCAFPGAAWERGWEVGAGSSFVPWQEEGGGIIVALMTPLDFPQAVARLCLHAQSGEERVLIALAGIPGSGKSTLAAALAAEVNRRLHPQAMIALSMDGFHLPKATLRQMPNAAEALARRGAPWTFDPAGLAAQLAGLRASAGLGWSPWPDFQHGVGDPVERGNVVAPQTRVILVEGLYLLHRADGWAPVEAAFDERWFLETELSVALQRLASRHMASWKITPEQAAARIAGNDRLNAEIVLATRARAEWLLSGEAPLQSVDD